ncbi:MAG: ferrous iron transport protein B [Oscillospiraceae bacterium]|nr:ferrous iron transport protein B [Oscillospiraceae bacterium]
MIMTLLMKGSDFLNGGNKTEKNIALAGNPNVGKSTVFNALTGMNQHTGNWTGKTVSTARGKCIRGDKTITLTDLPGTYSLMAHSAEEQVTRDYIAYGGSDGVIIVCDGSCLERNLNLVLQILEITPHAMVCVNLLDEAAKRGISVDTAALEELLGIPVCGAAARSGKGLDELITRAEELSDIILPEPPVTYPKAVEKAVSELSQPLERLIRGKISTRFAALRILERCEDFISTLDSFTCGELKASLSDEDSELGGAYNRAMAVLGEKGIDPALLRDITVTSIVDRAEEIARKAVHSKRSDSFERDRRIDRILTHRIWGLPLMLALLGLIFFITVKGANYPSEWLYSGFSRLGAVFREWLRAVGCSEWAESMLIDGIYGVLSRVVSVMLPPMAIFFPLFTLLEDVGYLPRAAFNLDRFFSRANASGKQSLTMAMGLGCNAAGITGCRIIDSPRERLIAILTNVFMPCNGRFPALIALIGFFAASSFQGTLILTAVIVLGAMLTFFISGLLSKTILKGESSSFALELPPYRRPQIGKVLVRSLFDRTIFVLGRAVTIAAPSGLVIWLMGNITVGGESILTHCSAFLDPFGQLFGMDGAIILGFILGFPANEIVLPLIMMIYSGGGILTDGGGAAELFAAQGWTAATAVCVIIFMLCHFPCATACLTVKKETGSWRHTLLAMALPTVTGLILCFAVNLIFGIFS